MPGSYSCLYYHIVFGTRERLPLIFPDVAAPLHGYMAGVIKGQGGIAVCIGGTADHVHILAELPRDKAVSDVVRDVKANSSRWMHQTHPEARGFGWQEGYGAFTVSVRGLPRVKAYIAGQAEHHRNTTCLEELASFLREHGVSYEGRYL